jgi:hypothetical protein
VVLSVFSGIGVAIITALWELGRTFLAKRRACKTQLPLPLEVAQRNRQTMLDRVRHMWVEGVLEQSLSQVARIELGLFDNRRATDYPSKLVVSHLERAPRTLPAGTRMIDVFDQFDKVLLIDGLDEVAPEHRDACAQAINVFREKHGLLPSVVCSRSADYATLTNRLRLRGAVTIQPLTRAQIEQYLKRLNTKLSGVIQGNRIKFG